MNLENIRNAGRKLLIPVIRLLIATGISPFAVTALGLLLTVVASWLVWDGKYITGVVVLIIGSILDAVDGELARKKGIESKAGAVFDSSCDRIGEIFLFAAILAGKAGNAHPELVYLVPAALGGSYMVSYVRARAEGVNLSCSVGLVTRTERLILLIMGLVVSGLWDTKAIVFALAILAVGTWFTAGQRMVKVF
ncbi:MAG: CDP-alcohol phosphatidyltransferase family protein, partial [Candidatus Fermentibacteraceae bacterium]|nr:CDP-alcohol phosphatidyltransferase family protein [Candidatus Fermentibacteraceae bacterium]